MAKIRCALRFILALSLCAPLCPAALHAQPTGAPPDEPERESVDDETRSPEMDPPLPPSDDVEEIMVTAQGRAQPLQEVSVSVAAYNQEYLDALGAQNIADISQFTPNLEIRSVYGVSTPTLFIRGVGLRDFNANSQSSVAVYNDDVYMNSPAGQLSQLFDVEQVEVLRGPQGALYGRNASAGAIRVLSRKPTGDFNGYARVTYGRFDQIDLESAIEAPIFEDLASLRVSGVLHLRDGITDNRCADDKFWRDADGSTSTQRRLDDQWRVFASCFNNTTRAPPPLGLGWDAGGPFPPTVGVVITDAQDAVVPPGIAKKVNDIDNWAGRGLLRIQPDNDSNWLLNVHGGKNRALVRQFQALGARVLPATGEILVGIPDRDGYIDPDTQTFRSTFPFLPIPAQSPEDGDVFAGDYNNTGPENLNLFGSHLTGEIPHGNYVTNSITAYEWNERLVEANVDGNPFIGLEAEFGNTSWQVSQEVKTLWDAGGDVTWLAGANFLYENLEVLNDILFDPGVVLPRITRQDYEQNTYYGSLYGYATWAPTNEFSLEGGLRWNIEHKDYEIAAFLLVDDVDPPTDSRSVTENAPSGDISINYRPREGINFYGKYSRGWKGPHFNGNVIIDQGAEGQSLIDPVKPEKVNALEIGMKSQWLDRSLRVNTAAFYYDYEDIQIFQIRNTGGGVPVQELISANDADIYGLEFELEARPFEGLDDLFAGITLFGSFAWLESRYTDFVTQRTEIIGSRTIVVTDDFSGNRLINAPRFAFAGFAQWDLPLGRFGALVPRFDWSFKDKVFFSPANLEPVSQGAFWLMNARLAYRAPGERIELAAWVRNLGDEIYRLDVIDLTRFQRSILYAFGDPRTYGLTLAVNF